MAVNQAAMRRRARVMRVVNVPMRAALSLPFATPLSGNLMLISYTGRTSGKAYRQPVSYVAPPRRASRPLRPRRRAATRLLHRALAPRGAGVTLKSPAGPCG